MARCLIGCGSNQGARREQLDRAIELLGVMPGITMSAVSRHRETRPVGGPPDQAPFLNGACLVETELGPHELLGTLAAVENTLHRDRSERWGPRTVDLDLLLYDELVIDDEVVDGAALTVPHPRMTTRRFVLEPAVEIAPDLPHPLAGCTLRDLLDNISQAHLHVAVVGVPGCGAAEVAGAIADATLARLVHSPAPLPWRPGRGTATDWSAALQACAKPLRSDSWPDDPHGTVADYWLGTFPTAAEDCLTPTESARLAAEHALTTAETVLPHVAIFLRASPAALAERVAFRASHEHSSNLYAELGTAGRSGDFEAALSRLQGRLMTALRCRHRSTASSRPLSVIVVDADDLARAVDEAIAAVEAVA